jgi:hypothetical protein
MCHAIILSRVRSIAAIGFLRYALERLAIILDLHKVTRAFVTLLEVAVIALKLGATSYRATPKAITCIFCHHIIPFPLLAESRW